MQVLELLVSMYKKLEVPDYISVCQVSREREGGGRERERGGRGRREREERDKEGGRGEGEREGRRIISAPYDASVFNIPGRPSRHSRNSGDADEGKQSKR